MGTGTGGMGIGIVMGVGGVGRLIGRRMPMNGRRHRRNSLKWSGMIGATIDAAMMARRAGVNEEGVYEEGVNEEQE